MRIESIQNEMLLDKYPIIELKVRGKEEELHNFFSDIQEHFDLANDEWTPEYAMLTMTFDYKVGEQTMTMIKNYTKNYIGERG